MQPDKENPTLSIPTDDILLAGERLAKYFDPNDLYRSMAKARLSNPILRRPDMRYDVGNLDADLVKLEASLVKLEAEVLAFDATHE